MRKLDKYGAFDLLESAIEGVQNINPERKARKKIFLEESSKKAERDALKKTLQWWSEILGSSEDLGEMISACQHKSDTAEEVLRKNMKAAVAATTELERSYRSVAFILQQEYGEHKDQKYLPDQRRSRTIEGPGQYPVHRRDPKRIGGQL